jgi:hypothetical protein
MSSAEPHAILTEVLHRFVAEVRARAGEFAGLSDHEAAVEAVRWPIIQEVNEAAIVAAERADYIHRSSARTRPDRWGRSLDRASLQGTGLIGLLRSDSDFAAHQLVTELIGYLAGPRIPIQRHVVLDAEIYLDGSMEIAGWRLWQPTGADLDAVRPIPTAAGHASPQGWEQLLYQESCWMLTRDDIGAEPRRSALFPGHLLDELWDPDSSISAWQPLLLLNLYSLDPVNIASEYEVEPGRFLERVRGNGLTSTPVGKDDEYEVVLHGPFSMTEEQGPQLQRFLSVMSERLATWGPGDTTSSLPRKGAMRKLQGSAERFLSLNPWLGYSGDVTFAKRRAEVIFWYIATLERLVTTEDPERTDLTRRVAQRTAVLIGRDDVDRLRTEQLVRNGYKVRSTLAHGDTPSQEGLDDLAKNLRAIARRVFARCIILGPALNIAQTCDQALLSAQRRQLEIETPIAQVAAQLGKRKSIG